MTAYTVAARLSGSRTYRSVIGAVPVLSREIAVAQLEELAATSPAAQLAIVELDQAEVDGYPVELTERTELRMPAGASGRALIANAPLIAAAAAAPAAVEEPAVAELEQLVVIPCGGSKLEQAAPAAELYTGGYFRACLAYARSIADDSEIRILSAKHGLLRLDAVVEPYDVRMGRPGSITREELVAQAEAEDLDGLERVTVVGGRAYVDAALAIWPTATTPLDGFAGLGYQLAELRRLRIEALEVVEAAPAAPGFFYVGRRATSINGTGSFTTELADMRPEDVACIDRVWDVYRSIEPIEPGGARHEHYSIDLVLADARTVTSPYARCACGHAGYSHAPGPDARWCQAAGCACRNLVRRADAARIAS